MVIKIQPQVIESKKTWQRFLIQNPFQIATLRRQVEMVDLQLPYFPVLERRGVINDGKAEALKLWRDRKASNQDKARYANKIKQLLDVIAAEIFPKAKYNYIEYMMKKYRFNEVELSEDTKKILDDFRKEMLPDEVITLENDNYYDLEQFINAAYDAYSTHIHVFQNINQQYLFLICIIGFLESLLPPMALSNWHQVPIRYYDCVLDKSAERLRLANCNAYYRTARDSHKGIGFDFCINPNNHARYREKSNYLSGISDMLKSGQWPWAWPEPKKQEVCAIQ